MQIRALCSMVIVATFGFAAPTAANNPPWCAAYRNGTTNCGFYTYEQCMTAIAGNGGFCNRNYIDGEPDKPAARRERTTKPKPKRKEEKERVTPVERVAPPPAAAQPLPVIVQPAPPLVVDQPPTARAPVEQPANSYQAARALILSGKYEAGIVAMKSLGFDDHPDVASSIGFASAKLGRFADARSWYDKALAADPNHISTWGYSGALHVSQGELDMARADLRRIEAICGGRTCREYLELEGLIATKGH